MFKLCGFCRILYYVYIKSHLSEPLSQFKKSKASILAGCYPLLSDTGAVNYYYYNNTGVIYTGETSIFPLTQHNAPRTGCQYELGTK